MCGSKHTPWLVIGGEATLLTILGVLARHADHWSLLVLAVFLDAVIVVWWLEQVGAP